MRGTVGSRLRCQVVRGPLDYDAVFLSISWVMTALTLLLPHTVNQVCWQRFEGLLLQLLEENAHMCVISQG